MGIPQWLPPQHCLVCQREECKRCRLATEEAQSGVDTTFQAYAWPLTNMASLKYLSRLLTATKKLVNSGGKSMRGAEKLETNVADTGKEGGKCLDVWG